MKIIRFEDMRAERLLMKDYFQEVVGVFKTLNGLDEIGRLIADLERKFSGYIGTKHALAVNSGTDALQLSLLALGIGRADRVIVPNVTYPAVPLSVIYAGAEPVLVDIQEKDLEIDEAAIAKHVKSGTKAIIAAHMFARPCGLEKILKIAGKHKLFVIEDACQAESSEYKGKKLGSFGDLSCFSFSYYKPLSSCGGGGGMVCFNEDKYRKIADSTTVWKDDAVLLEAGKRFPRMYLMDLLSISAKFKNIERIKGSRLAVKKIYEEELGRVGEIRIFRDGKDSLSVPQNFVILSGEREELGRHLKKNGVIWQEPYRPLHALGIFKKYASGKYPVSEKYWKQAIQLPLFTFMEEEECLRVIELIKSFYGY